jgi:hypothetical protein
MTDAWIQPFALVAVPVWVALWFVGSKICDRFDGHSS